MNPRFAKAFSLIPPAREINALKFSFLNSPYGPGRLISPAMITLFSYSESIAPTVTASPAPKTNVANSAEFTFLICKPVSPFVLIVTDCV